MAELTTEQFFAQLRSEEIGSTGDVLDSNTKIKHAKERTRIAIVGHAAEYKTGEGSATQYHLPIRLRIEGVEGVKLYDLVLSASQRSKGKSKLAQIAMAVEAGEGPRDAYFALGRTQAAWDNDGNWVKGSGTLYATLQV